ncbi:hypothetical protein K438DRAFT_1997375 [Mycena galopus ATCC 62051]|nr:hypothetical protein K438DRAFT_1997375 [Mycena galopus ATCC 62051]
MRRQTTLYPPPLAHLAREEALELVRAGVLSSPIMLIPASSASLTPPTLVLGTATAVLLFDALAAFCACRLARKSSA